MRVLFLFIAFIFFFLSFSDRVVQPNHVGELSRTNNTADRRREDRRFDENVTGGYFVKMGQSSFRTRWSSKVSSYLNPIGVWPVSPKLGKAISNSCVILQISARNDFFVVARVMITICHVVLVEFQIVVCSSFMCIKRTTVHDNNASP